ncbi:DUF6527 family protein [Sphaerisporangium flaviroseum]|uniref:DUF6527 family protein n=1 Tax=Sphaerisporangium flaviroseum TaxID=509199 RepID=A0ABP7J2R2_9ACTN
MTATAFLRPEFVESFPPELEPRVLYVSIPYATCGHLCVCGCGHEIVTPLSPAQWTLTYNGRDVSLSPSIGNWGLPCRSHYWIREGAVRWCRRFTAREIADNRERDRRDLQEHHADTAPGPIARLYRRLGL